MHEPIISLHIGTILPLLYVYKDVFGIKNPTKFKMPLNKEIKPKQTKHWDYVTV